MHFLTHFSIDPSLSYDESFLSFLSFLSLDFSVASGAYTVFIRICPYHEIDCPASPPIYEKGTHQRYYHSRKKTEKSKPIPNEI